MTLVNMYLETNCSSNHLVLNIVFAVINLRHSVKEIVCSSSPSTFNHIGETCDSHRPSICFPVTFAVIVDSRVFRWVVPERASKDTDNYLRSE